MSLPYTILNGQIPDATKLMANFNYLLAGGAGALPTGTYTAHKSTAAAAPATAFICLATGGDGLIKGLFIYCGDITQGDGGFIQLAGWE